LSTTPSATELVHYLIAARGKFEDALAHGGSGTLTQGGNWRKAQDHFELARLQGGRLSLLLGDSVYIDGAEWMACATGFKELPSGQTQIGFSDLQVLARPIPRSSLIKVRNDEPISEGYRHGNVACFVPKALLRPMPVRSKLRAAQEKLAQTFGAAEALQEIDNDPRCLDVSETTRVALANARIGQGRYRRSLLNLWGRSCSLTGCSLEAVLVASHAKRWADSTNAERLDPYNGLLLAASFDRLFDCGDIAFSDSGALLQAPGVTSEQLAHLAGTLPSQLRQVRDEHRPYLAAHRKHFGFP
jgi:hypothetical protein